MRGEGKKKGKTDSSCCVFVRVRRQGVCVCVRRLKLDNWQAAVAAAAAADVEAAIITV